MTIVVYATSPSERFHHTRECPQRTSAQNMSDVDCGCDTYCTHKMPRTHPVLRMELGRALRDGKRPCYYCYRDPQLLSTVMPPSQETFGHVPVDEYAGTEPGANGVSHLVCFRCIRWTWVKDVKVHIGQRIAWPCTSAIVLGLVPRPTAE